MISLRTIPGEAKIILVIIFAIVLPTIVLSTFGVRAISAERSDFEQSIRRRGEMLSRQVAARSVQPVLDCADKLALLCRDSSNTAQLSGGVKTLADGFHCARSPFVVEENGTFVVPSNLAFVDILNSKAVSREITKEVADAFRLEFASKDDDSAFDAYTRISASTGDTLSRYSALLGQARIMCRKNRLTEAIAFYKEASRAGDSRDENGLLIAPAAQAEIISITSHTGQLREHCAAVIRLLRMLIDDRGLLSPEEAAFHDEFLKPHVEKARAWAKSAKEEGGDFAGELDSLLKKHKVIDEQERFCIFLRESVLPEMCRLGVTTGGQFLTRTDGKEEKLILFCRADIPGSDDSRWRGFAGIQIDRQDFVSRFVASEVDRVSPSGELLITVRGADSLPLFARDEAKNLCEVASSNFPEPFARLSAVAFLRGYKSLDALSSMRTKIYVWAVLISITGVAAGVLFTYVAVRRQLRLARQRSDFVSNVTHELKTPLTSIQMFAETLSDGRIRDRTEARQCVDVIVRESRRLSNLIEKVLDFGRIERGGKVYRFEKCDPYALIVEALRTFRSGLKGRPCTVYANVPKSLPAIYADKEALEEAVLNLLSNAYKYTVQDERKIWINAKDSGETLRIEVIDKGIGIPKREQKAIFKKFYRVDDSLTRLVDGTGLGLTIAAHIARAHKGKIEVESKVGEGSKFTLVIAKQTSQEKEQNSNPPRRKAWWMFSRVA
jgi:two-component system phosphate regulon sensor histidine kinase PhoR